ncbi:hypothetical protein E1B28_001835 [Marasmius oreades]|uniref:CxC1-like cysteine cluster associated with KDZ transposases domain-containing protein n=1 Tax=Marasmius oreades TaxID=181124 RepID=A0A9P8AG61_9AGAR|nr:uncharacterized protein E1B28_001835 [Marasmius oreades]KAG7100050.1 hypothetical protein E1B28_001835 [Marasmius oreades]
MNRRLKTLYRSPVKKSKSKANTWVRIPGQQERKDRLEKKLEELLNRATSASVSATQTLEALGNCEDVPDTQDITMDTEDPSSVATDWVDMEDNCEADEPLHIPAHSENAPSNAVNVESGTQLEARKVDNRWKALLSSLIEPFITYRNETVGRVDYRFEGFTQLCTSGSCRIHHSRVQCYLYDHHQELGVPYCECSNLPQTLVHHGFFPTSPSQPRVAFSIALLDLYHALREKSCDAVTALAGALDKVYKHRGFRLLSTSV